MNSSKLLAGTALALVAAISTANAATTFTDRAAFTAAVSGAITTPVTTLETFEGRALVGLENQIDADTDTGVGSLALSGFGTISGTGVEAFSGQGVDSTPVKILGEPTGGAIPAYNTTPGGSNFLFIDTDRQQGFTTTITFEKGLLALGFDYTSAGLTNVPATVTIQAGGASYELDAFDGFFGFLADAGTPITGLTITTPGGGLGTGAPTGGDSAIGFDDFALVTPVPAALPLLASAVAGLGFVAARRRRA